MSSLALSFAALLVLGTHPPGPPVPAYTVEREVLLRLDLVNGTEFPATTIGTFPPELAVRALAFDTMGAFYGIDAAQDQLLRIDPDTAAVEVVGPLGFEVRGGAMAFDACGRLWLLEQQDFVLGEPRRAHLYRIDPRTGQGRLRHTLDGNWHGLAAFDEGLLTTEIIPGLDLQLRRIIPASGEIVEVFPLPGISILPYLGFDLDGDLWALTPGPIIGPPPPALGLSIDLESGEVAEISSLGFHRDFTGLAIAPPGGRCATTCAPAPDALCLNDGRFRVEIDWRDFADRQGRGQVAVAASDDSGLFWFFQRDNWELLVKVLDGCVQNDHFWVFASAATNVEFELTITDTATGETWSRFNPLGQLAETIADTRAFATCP